MIIMAKVKLGIAAAFAVISLSLVATLYLPSIRAGVNPAAADQRKSRGEPQANGTQRTTDRAVPGIEPTTAAPATDPTTPDAGDREPGVSLEELTPRPWETAVRVRVIGTSSIGFGSGTIIYSSSSESLLITCADIFKLDGRRQTMPSAFPPPIKIDLFDGRLLGRSPAQVHFLERVDGEAVDYDFVLDVARLRIRPGRRLFSSPVVPPWWQPKERAGKMFAVGCSEGHDATVWTTSGYAVTTARPRQWWRKLVGSG
jgi:hypothetical protein